MNIPTIGGARGIFEFFVPGIFLLLNLGVAAYLFPYTDSETRRIIAAGASSPALALVVGVSFGYLIGVVLRLFQTDLPDHLSAAWLRKFARNARQENDKPQEKGKFKLWATEEFPYIGWMEQVCKLYLPPEALDFYNKTWGRRRPGEQNKQFFTFVKIMVSSNDERATGEMYAAEALSRYISGMFYALLFASFFIGVTVIICAFVSHQILTGLLVILLAYLFVIVVILAHYRFIRIKEVEIVFAASFRNKSIFEETKTADKKGILKVSLDWLQQLLLSSPKTKQIPESEKAPKFRSAG